MINKEFLEQVISLAYIELITIDLPQVTQFTSAIGVRNSRKTLIVKWVDEDGVIGYGECSCRPDPYYSAEFTDSAIEMIRQFVIPYLKSQQTFADVLGILKRIRGWNFTKGALEGAIFNIAEQKGQFDLSKYIIPKPISKVPVGISLGIYKDKGEIYDKVQSALSEGYQRLKFKISPHVDTSVFDYINPLLFDSKVKLGFDANGSYGIDNLDQFAYFAETYQTKIEQPFPPTRFDVYLKAKDRFPQLEVCADEEVKCIGDLIKLHKLSAIDELNLKVGRVGGIVNSIEIINYCYEHNIPCWIGGMFETGIGRSLNLKFASFLPSAIAHDLSPSARYFHQDVVSPEVTMSKGFVDMEKIKQCAVLPKVIAKYTVDSFVKKY